MMRIGLFGLANRSLDCHQPLYLNGLIDAIVVSLRQPRRSNGQKLVLMSKCKHYLSGADIHRRGLQLPPNEIMVKALFGAVDEALTDDEGPR